MLTTEHTKRQFDKKKNANVHNVYHRCLFYFSIVFNLPFISPFLLRNFVIETFLSDGRGEIEPSASCVERVEPSYSGSLIRYLRSVILSGTCRF